ncbi:unnamed protein product [Rhizoctonia solani]|uniref:Uncharacterized protein n=1 Tax=Rhizoctonia solani TaxID=456999 RepID=A0A8H3DUJ4_9AGAM|nr:unnamed protein product [Rhizoctonia solani]
MSDLQWSWKKDSSEATEFITLVRTTLPLLPNLKDLGVFGAALTEDPSFPFTLDSLVLTTPSSNSAWDFLRAQKSLTYLDLRQNTRGIGCFSPETIPNTLLLPKLTTLKACPEVFAALAPRHAITYIHLQECGRNRYGRSVDGVVTALNHDQLSRSLRTLRVEVVYRTFQSMCCVDFVQYLASTKASTTLVKLVLVKSFLDYSPHLPDARSPKPLSLLPKLLHGFSNLRHLIVEDTRREHVAIARSPSGDGLRELLDSIIEQAGGPELWAAYCPGLVEVEIYGSRLLLSPP